MESSLSSPSSSWHRIRVISDERYLQLYPSTSSMSCGALIMPSLNDNHSNSSSNSNIDDTLEKFKYSNQYHMFLYKLDAINTFRINSNNKSNSNNSNYLQYHKGSKELLVQFHLLNNDDNNGYSDNNTTSISPSSSLSSISDHLIIISLTFSRQFGLMDDDIVHCRLVPIQSVSLQRVILIAQDIQSFESVTIPPSSQESSTSSSKLRYKANQQFKSFVVNNAITFIQSSHISMDSQSTFTVLECYPMLQGCINDSTTLIIISPDSTTNTTTSTTTTPSSNLQYQHFLSSNNSNNNNNLRISNFIIHPLSTPTSTSPSTSTHPSRSPLFHFTPNSNRTLSNNMIQSSVISSIPYDIDTDIIDKQYDYMNDCLVTLTTLKQMGLFHGSHIKLNNTKLNQQVVVRIYSIIPIGLGLKLINRLSLKDGIIYLPPCQSFNLGLQQLGDASPLSHTSTLELSILNHSGLDRDGGGGGGSLNHNIFPIANKIKISRINTPDSDGYTSYTDQLMEYFDDGKIRIMKQGDIFVVKDHLSALSKTNHLIYFKVEQIQSPTIINSTTLTIGPPETDLFIIDRKKCTIIQEGSSHSFLPYNIKQFSDRYYHPDTSCIAYNDEFKQLINIISPFINHHQSNNNNNINNNTNNNNQSDILLDYNCSILIKGTKGIGKKTIMKQVADQLGLNIILVDCYELFSFMEKEKEENLKSTLIDAADNVPCIVVLDNFDVLEQSPSTSLLEKKESNITSVLKESIQLINDKLAMMTTSNNSDALNQFIVVANVESTDDMSGKLTSWFKYELELSAPNENQRLNLLKSIYSKIPINGTVSLSNIAMRTASFLPLNLLQLAERSAMASLKRVFQSDKINVDAEDICACGVVVCGDDISDALADMQGYQSSSIGAPKIPNVKWDDVGGLANVKSEIMDTIQLPLENPHLFASGIGKRSGILLYGPPGTGKTLMAKAIATECSLNFLSVKGPELINMYIGESEKNIRDIFNRARQAKPCVIFFDELDSLAPARGAGADSGGVMDRVVSQLLAELDGMQKSSDVFIIGATNRPDLLDPALMIPGRLDRLLYLGISSDKDSQLKIVQALTRKFHLAEDVDLRAVVEQCPFNLTGSDFYALCSDALANSIKDKINDLELKRKEVKEEDREEWLEKQQREQRVILVGQKHFLEAVDNLVPSVSQDELQYYHKVQKQFSMNK